MKYFWKELVLDVPDSVYYPREDSELLAEVLEKEELKGRKCLEIGCGSGLLSIIMAKKGGDVTAADINEAAVTSTKKNAEANGAKINAIYSDLFENVEGRFDVIVFNAPYLPDGTDISIVQKIRKDKNASHLRDLNIVRQWSGGPTGRETIERFAKYAKNFLNPGGKILLCISSLTGEEEVKKTFSAAGFSANAIAREKVPWEEIIVVEIR